MDVKYLDRQAISLVTIACQIVGVVFVDSDILQVIHRALGQPVFMLSCITITSISHHFSLQLICWFLISDVICSFLFSIARLFYQQLLPDHVVLLGDLLGVRVWVALSRCAYMITCCVELQMFIRIFSLEI